MEKYIQEGDLLLDNYEWSGGHMPKPKELARRRKLLAEGKVDLRTIDNWFGERAPKKIIRKK